MIFDSENKYLNAIAVLLFVAILVASFMFTSSSFFRQTFLGTQEINYENIAAYVASLNTSNQKVTFEGKVDIGENNVLSIELTGKAEGNLAKKCSLEQIYFEGDVEAYFKNSFFGGQDTCFQPFKTLGILNQGGFIQLSSFSTKPNIYDVKFEAARGNYGADPFEWSWKASFLLGRIDNCISFSIKEDVIMNNVTFILPGQLTHYEPLTTVRYVQMRLAQSPDGKQEILFYHDVEEPAGDFLICWG
jgi:hypothetical protein